MLLGTHGLRKVCSVFIGVFVLVATFQGFMYPVFADLDDAKRSELQKDLDQLEREAQGLDIFIGQTQKEAQSLANAKKTLEAEVKRREIEIRKLTLSLKKTALEISKKRSGVAELSKKIDTSRQGLSASILLLYTYGQENPLTILLKHSNISTFFRSVDALNKVQSDIQTTLKNSRDDRALLQKEEDELEEFGKDQQDLKVLQEVERRALARKKQEKDELIRLTKGKEAIFQQLLKSKQKDIAALRSQLFYLEKTGITAEDALRLADLAAKRVGIRTEFLLALLEVETGRQFEGGIITVGTNLGSGIWQADMNPNQRTAFLKITEELGFDPDRMPISARPCSKATRERIGPGKPCGYGWGGAMGPAQFIPTTWLLFKDRVAKLTGHVPPNPWSAEDAFTASALFLADAGARSQTAVGETKAAKTYLSGRSTCNTASCKSYARTILSLATTIGKIL